MFRVGDDRMETVPTQGQRFAQPQVRPRRDGDPIPVQLFSYGHNLLFLVEFYCYVFMLFDNTYK